MDERLRFVARLVRIASRTAAEGRLKVPSAPAFIRGRGRRAHGPCGDREDPDRCAFWERCRERKLACRRFYVFARAQSGWRTAALVPSRAFYETVFSQNDRDFGAARTFELPAPPTEDAAFVPVPHFPNLSIARTGHVRRPRQGKNWELARVRECEGQLTCLVRHESQAAAESHARGEALGTCLRSESQWR